VRLAIAEWSGQVATVLDFSRSLLVVNIEDGVEVAREQHQLDPASPSVFANRIRKFGVDVLICGAISRRMVDCFEDCEFELIAQIQGSVEEVLDAYRNGRLDAPSFRLPGCRGRGQGGRRRRGRGRVCSRNWSSGRAQDS